MPGETLDAYRDHGEPAARLEEGVAESRTRLENLAQVGIDIDQVTEQLEQEGVDKFNRPFDNLMQTLKEERARFRAQTSGAQRFAWGSYGRSIARRLAALEHTDFVSRLWRRDPALWADGEDQRRGIGKALGWLQAPAKVLQGVGDLLLFAREVKAAGFRQVVHMGMGGSSLAPMVFQRSFAPGGNGLPLTVLDATDPAAVAAVSAQAPPERTLYIAASKSGTTTEAVDFMEYAYAAVREVKGERAGENFVVITDPGTPLAATAGERGFRRLFVNLADVGGRYSALTLFGLVPAALMGLDVETLLARALRMRRACGNDTPALANPGLMLGCVLGELALQGRNKVTFVMPEAVATLGMWLEQLLAESTGKEGTGLLPVAGETLAGPEAYGNDRVFVQVLLGQDDVPTLDRVAALRDAGHPVVTIRMADRYDLAQEFYRWEIAVAAAGAVLDVNVFNQPNVQESKDNTRAILKELRDSGALPEGKPDLAAETIAVYGCPGARDLEGALGAFLQTAAPGDYCALLAYIREDDAHTEAMTRNLRDPLQRQLKMATTLGYGPRYLHSTGQFHKGGPNSGLYLMFTTDAPDDIPVPERFYGFGQLRLAQAIGDLQALQQHGRRVLRFHLGADVTADLNRIGKALQGALEGLKP
jgi:transaldolase/glucose-6-phosphate isomerase